MNCESVTLYKLALASAMYDSLTPFNKSLKLLSDGTDKNINLANPEHRRSLLRWLNDWGCRHLAEDQHDVASESIGDWYKTKGVALFEANKPLWELEDGELEAAAWAYGALKDMAGARRIRGGRDLEISIGPTAASKILFAIRPKALLPWDEAMRVAFKCSGSPGSYVRYLKRIRKLTLDIADLCQSKGFQIDDVPRKLGRPDSTVVAIVNEYIWITETRKIQLPSLETLNRWVSLG
jgi:hypothetical protein